ncbi:MAG: CvpA family protein [Patescibacteria group bacterium]
MLIVDLVLAFILLGFVGMGLKDGFVYTLGRFIGAILGFLAARAWSIYLVGILGLFMPAGWAQLIAFILIFVLITRLFGIAFKLVDGVFEIIKILPFLKSIDKFLGAFLGLVEGVIVMGGVIYLVLNLKLSPTLIIWFSGSHVAVWVESVFHTLLGILL